MRGQQVLSKEGIKLQRDGSMQHNSLVSFSSVFTLRDGVSEEEFLPKLHAFFNIS
jgi:hypothetical protein